MTERIDHAAVAIDAIDETLKAIPVSIEAALKQAVARGDMSADEAQECLGAYEQAFVDGLQGGQA